VQKRVVLATLALGVCLAAPTTLRGEASERRSTTTPELQKNSSERISKWIESQFRGAQGGTKKRSGYRFGILGDDPPPPPPPPCEEDPECLARGHNPAGG
jgi:hypothetical protein